MSVSCLGWLPAIAAGTEDDFDCDYLDDLVPSTVQCKYCGAKGLYWAQTSDGKWRLQLSPGPTEHPSMRHYCATPAVTLSLNGVVLPTHSATAEAAQVEKLRQEYRGLRSQARRTFTAAEMEDYARELGAVPKPQDGVFDHLCRVHLQLLRRRGGLTTTAEKWVQAAREVLINLEMMRTEREYQPPPEERTASLHAQEKPGPYKPVYDSETGNTTWYDDQGNLCVQQPGDGGHTVYFGGPCGPLYVDEFGNT